MQFCILWKEIGNWDYSFFLMTRDGRYQPGRRFNCRRNLKNWSVLLFVDIHVYFCLWVAGYFLRTGTETRWLYMLVREINSIKVWLDRQLTVSLKKRNVRSGQTYRVCLNVAKKIKPHRRRSTFLETASWPELTSPMKTFHHLLKKIL